MKVIPNRPPGQPVGVATVQSWGVDPVGATQMESILARSLSLLSGFTQPTPAGWGEPGSVPTTDQHIWASPQAFTGGGGRVALSTWAVGADRPTVYPQDAHSAQVVLPGPSGV